MIPFFEAERLVEQLESNSIKEYGGRTWIKQHKVLTRLNLQAHINAAMRGDEYIMESLATFDKVKTLIEELLISEIWKDNLLPLLKTHILDNASMKGYLVLFHEAVLANLLENICFHRTAVDAAGEHLIELMDYCYRYLSKMVQGKISYPEKKISKETLNQPLDREAE